MIQVLNEAIQKAKEGLDTQFSQLRYASLGAIFALLTKKANARLLISRLLNILIWAKQSVNMVVVGVKVLEYWKFLKLYRMSIERYLNKGKIYLLK